MNKQPIEMANDADLRLSPRAMQHAVKRARKLALQTGTSLVVRHQGVVDQVAPEAYDTDFPKSNQRSDR